MFTSRHGSGWIFALTFALSAAAHAGVSLRDASLDKPLVLDQNTSYDLQNVSVVGVRDAAALTLSGQIESVTIHKSSFGNIWSGATGKATGLDCAGAIVGSLVATDSNFYNAENQLVCLREGSFGHVVFQHCTFKTTDAFLKEMYTHRPWRDWPPVAEFYNIDRLELLDNEYTNTVIVIHPSVKQVVFRGPMPQLQVQNPDTTQVFRLEEGQAPQLVAMAPPAPPKPAQSATVDENIVITGYMLLGFEPAEPRRNLHP